MGSQTVIVSKGGSNRFHGDVFEYLRNNVMDAANFFDKPTAANGNARLPQLQRNQFGGSFGGPIKKDKTFFFGCVCRSHYANMRDRRFFPIPYHPRIAKQSVQYAGTCRQITMR